MGTGIKFTKKGWQFFEEEILKTYYNPEKREDIVKIAKVLNINLIGARFRTRRKNKKFISP